jgi:hypothetical protein
MNDQMFDMYRQATASWLRMQQELFDGLYKSAIHLFLQPSQVLGTKSPEDHPRVSGANGSKPSKATRKPSPGTARPSRKVAGKRPGARP